MADKPNSTTRIKGIDSGASVQKGAPRPLQEGESRGTKPSKPAGLSRPKPVAVPPATSQAKPTDKK